MKCPQCGLVNFKTASQCKRCGMDFQPEAEAAQAESVEAWRDARHLVLRSDSFLPDRCMKCNSSTDITRKSERLAYYPKYNLLTLGLALVLPFGFLRYKTMMVPLGLCPEHDSGGKNLLIGSGLVALGIIALFGGFAIDVMPVMFLGPVVLGAGFILMVIKGSPVAIVKFDGRHMWLKGPGNEYLAEFPAWASR